MSDYPSPSLSVKLRGELLGGWSRMFRMSLESREERDIIIHEGDPDFWRVWVVAKCEEALEEAIDQAVQICRRRFRVSRPIADLRRDLRRELIRADWKPPVTQIKKEMAELKRQKREELTWLRRTLTQRKQRGR